MMKQLEWRRTMNRSVELYETLPIRPLAIRRYLFATGWKRLKLKGGVLAPVPYELYRLDSAKASQAQVVLPRQVEMADWQLRVRDAIQTLVDVEERSATEVIQAIQRVGYDVVRSAIPSDQVTDDTIRLASATEFVAYMRSLLAATATTERKPIPFFGRLRKDSVLFADSCRFGHTYRGSFGFVVESPLPEPEPMPLLPDNPTVPFERRVVQRLARGIANVVAATTARDTKLITAEVSTGLSANGCEELAGLIDKVNPAGMQFTFDLSPEWSMAREMNSATFSLNGSHAEVCLSAARELRRNDTVLPVRVSGLIVRLQNQTDPTDLSNRTGEHEILVLWGSRDYGDIQVRVNLSPTDYLSAVGAHGTGRPVLVSGALSKVGRQWLLTNPSDFVIPVQGELAFEEEN